MLDVNKATLVDGNSSKETFEVFVFSKGCLAYKNEIFKWHFFQLYLMEELDWGTFDQITTNRVLIAQ